MKILKNRIAVLLVLLIFTPCLAGARENNTSRQAQALMQDFFEAGNSPGLSVSVGLNGKIVWSAGYGYADLEQKVAVDPANTLFRIGSVVKSMTAYAAAQLVEAGKLDLDEPVQKYVPGFPLKQWPISTRQLLAHLAGIRHYAGSEFFSSDHYATVLNGLVIFQDDPLVHEPGTAYLYSSYGFNLASAVIEKASGQAYLDYMAEHVFDRFGMTRTVPDFLPQIIPGRGRYYYQREGQVLNAPEVDNSYKWASGGVIGSSDDLVRFGLAQFSDDSVSRATRDVFWTMQKTRSGEETGYGLGWRIATDENEDLWIGHGGGSVGGTTQFWIQPESGLVIAMISNMSSFNFETILVSLGGIFLNTE